MVTLMETIKIVGQRGSWFAKANGNRLPIMWADEMTKSGSDTILRTDWLETLASDNAGPKRASLVEYFKNHLGSSCEFIVARAKDIHSRPREILRYVGVFRGIVTSIEPEIELRVTDRIADAKR